MLNPRLSKPGFQTATLFAGVVLLVIIFVSGGYFFMLPAEPQEPATDPALAELERQRALWARRRPDFHEYVVDRDCACGEAYDRPYRVRVTPQGTTVSYDIGIPGDGVPPSAPDIDGLFELAADAVAGADSVQVFYDADYGFPMILSIDWDEGEAGDDESVDVREFRPLR